MVIAYVRWTVITRDRSKAMTKQFNDPKDHTTHYLRVGRRLQGEAVVAAFGTVGRFLKRLPASLVAHRPSGHHRPA